MKKLFVIISILLCSFVSVNSQIETLYADTLYIGHNYSDYTYDTVNYTYDTVKVIILACDTSRGY